MTSYQVECELGERILREKFTDKGEASAFVKAVVKEEPLRWKGSTEASGKGGVLTVRSKHLEDLVEMDAGSLSPETASKVNTFLNGKWKNEVKKKRAPPEPAGLVTLKSMAEELKTSPRVARAKLRAMKIKKPSSGWNFTPSEAKKIKAKLQEALKATVQ